MGVVCSVLCVEYKEMGVVCAECSDAIYFDLIHRLSPFCHPFPGDGMMSFNYDVTCTLCPSLPSLLPAQIVEATPTALCRGNLNALKQRWEKQPAAPPPSAPPHGQAPHPSAPPIASATPNPSQAQDSPEDPRPPVALDNGAPPQLPADGEMEGGGGERREEGGAEQQVEAEQEVEAGGVSSPVTEKPSVPLSCLKQMFEKKQLNQVNTSPCSLIGS